MAENSLPEDKPLVGFLGVPGSYSEQALIEYFGDNKVAVNFQDFEGIFEALNESKLDYGIVPIENSSTGGIAEVYDLLGNYPVEIVGERIIQVVHCLMSLPGAKLEEIEEVYSMPQAFTQCSAYIKKRLGWNQVAYASTAGSAKKVSEMDSLKKAAIASRRAAEIYSLDILAEGINDHSNNYTRFVVIKKKNENVCAFPKIISEKGKPDKISITLSLPHEPGSLFGVLRHFETTQVNLLKIESRPALHKPWEYVFYIDFEGSLAETKIADMLEVIEKGSVNFRMLGNYRAHKLS